MRAAIYARKSTEQNVAPEAKSVTRQVDNARAFAAARGWTVDDAHVFVDDGKSGAEFARRPGFSRMMGLLDPRAPFDVLVVSEQKSIGREMFETNMAIKTLAEAGVEVFEYVHGKSLTPKNWMDKVMSAFQAGADEAHREQTSERIHEAHTRRAKAGHVTGGRLFGYVNVDVCSGTDPHGRPLRSHVERRINPDEARVILRIYELYDAGLGLKRIARTLNAEGAPSPKYSSPKDGLPPVGGWSTSTVRAILSRETFHGVVVWNKSRKRTAWGKVGQSARPESEWIRTPAEQLRIIPEDLWNRVASRRRDTEGRALRFQSGRLSGRPPKHATQNLLAGIATCGLCGGGMVVETSSGPRGSGRPYRYYACARRRRTGVCTNELRISVDDMNEAVLFTMEEHALTPEAVEQVILLTETNDVRDQHARLDRELKDVERRTKRVVDAIAEVGTSPSLVAKLKQLESRKKALRVEIANLHPIPRLAPAVIESRLAEWRRLLRQSTTQGRAVLQRILRGRLTFTPLADGDGYEFSGPTRFDRLFTGVAVSMQVPAWMRAQINEDDLTGTEGIGPEDTHDADYGRLLERVQDKADKTDKADLEKGWRPWRDSNPRSSP
jgi:site-specific DNA recombinase